MTATGRYRILTPLHTGRKSVIYRGYDEGLDRPVVIKTLNKAFPTAAEIRSLETEYLFACDIAQVPGIIRVYDYIPYQNGSAIVMEDIGGESLDNLINDKPLPLKPALRYAAAIADILDSLHMLGIMYKDMKPHNVIVNPDTQELKLIDFGLSSKLKREDFSGAKSFGGTAAYISPEQTGCMNRMVDYRTDLYSFGVTLFEMLTGRLPFDLKDHNALVNAHIAKLPPRLGSMGTPLPRVLDDIVDLCLKKNPEERYQSAYGIKADLERVLADLERNNAAAEFPAGENDVSRRFQVSGKLYGRDSDFLRLLVKYKSAVEGGKEAVFIHGPAGIGKTAFINEFLKYIATQGGFYLRGTFEKVKMHIPYEAIVQSMDMLVRKILCEREEIVLEWKNRILKAVGPNGKIITDMSPLFATVLGVQPALPELSPSKRQNRFNAAVTGLFNACVSFKPLVMCIEDMQWADRASIRLLHDWIASSGARALLFIGTIREDEGRSQAEIKTGLAEGANILDVDMGPLDDTAVNLLLSDTLRLSEGVTSGLARIIGKKTAGNPFFIHMLLADLYVKKYIEHDGVSWVYDEEKIARVKSADNVADLVAGKIDELPENALALIKTASCFGGKIFIDVLEELAGLSRQDFDVALFWAYNEGFLIDESVSGARSAVFAHQRIYEAVYALLGEPEKQKMHYSIGKAMYVKYAATDGEDMLFIVVNQLNKAPGLLFPKERELLAALDCDAGRAAKAKTAFETAAALYRAARELLPDDIWETSYARAFDTYLSLAESEYLSTRFDEATVLLDELATRARNRIDRARVSIIKMYMFASKNRGELAVEIGIRCLKDFGIRKARFSSDITAC
jgi:serine/threonine protein kinase